ncbi:MAG: 2-oxoglutarate oxidoreductase, partial [Candidatus Zixiibacteriota bacterium]
TSPAGRDVNLVGHPIRMSELLSTLKTDSYIARCSVHTPLHAVAAKKIIKKAFRLQKENRCFSLVEVLSTCPTNWGIMPCDATKWVASDMQPYYPLGIFRDPEKTEAKS